MKALISPGKISGTITPPHSKSITQRLYAAALLHKGETIIHNYGSSADELAALEIIKPLGAKIISQSEEKIIIESNGIIPVSEKIFCNESGLAARLFTPIAALSDRQINIEAAGSLLQRPMQGFEKIFSQTNVSLIDFNGYLPFAIKGPLIAADIVIEKSVSSQFLSGILFALSHVTDKKITVRINNLQSKPYIDLTIDVLQQFGKNVLNKSYEYFVIEPSDKNIPKQIETTVEADWSSAAFWLAAGAISGEIKIKQLDKNSKQADKKILDVLEQCGANIHWHHKDIVVASAQLTSFNIDATDTPDLIPVLSVLASCCEGISMIKGIHRLIHKESNRKESTINLLQLLHVDFEEKLDSFFIAGKNTFPSFECSSFNDHRMVMAGVLASLKSTEKAVINNCEAIRKSYPLFFEDLKTAGINCLLDT